MNFDYSKVVSFLFEKNIPKLNQVFKTIIESGFVMTHVDENNKVIFLNKNGVQYFLLKTKERVVILPINYRTLSFADDFGEIIEISINIDGDIVLSNIFNLDNPSGVVASTCTWHFANNLYTQIVGRVAFFTNEKIEVINNRESIEMFIETYYPRRRELFGDLYWDMDLLGKNNFIEPLVSERIQVNDGYNGEEFNVLYKKYNDKVISVVKEKGKPSLFDVNPV